MPEMHYVVSSNVAAIGYNVDNQELHVEFVSGSVYVYFNVDEQVFYEFMQTESKGGYLNGNIKGVYDYGRL